MSYCETCSADSYGAPLCSTCEALAEVERLREALRGLVESVEYEDAPPLSGALKQARAALAGKAEP